MLPAVQVAETRFHREREGVKFLATALYASAAANSLKRKVMGNAASAAAVGARA